MYFLNWWKKWGWMKSFLFWDCRKNGWSSLFLLYRDYIQWIYKFLILWKLHYTSNYLKFEFGITNDFIQKPLSILHDFFLTYDINNSTFFLKHKIFEKKQTPDKSEESSRSRAKALFLTEHFSRWKRTIERDRAWTHERTQCVDDNPLSPPWKHTLRLAIAGALYLFSEAMQIQRANVNWLTF